MAYTTKTWSVGEALTAAKMQALQDNTTYLKAQTDQLFVAVYNNDSVTLNQYDAVVIDPSYTAGLAVKTSTVTGDMRAFGVVMSASISSHSSGIVAFDRLITNINVNGAVAFGHSLQIGPNAHYAQDSGGGNMMAAGMLGTALGSNASGNATIPVLLNPNPLFYTAAQVITQKYGGNDIITGGSTTICANVVNATPNQCLLFGAWNASSAFSGPLWNAQTPTVLQAYNAGTGVAYIGALVGLGAATAGFMGNFSGNKGCGVAIALNGINQGGGTATFGAVAHNYYSSAGAISLTVTCVPGDLVICIIQVYATSGQGLSAENQTSVEKATGTNTMYEVLSAVATGTSVTFTATLAGTSPLCSMDGLALHTA